MEENIYYQSQVDNSMQSIPDTQTTGNDSDNWEEKAKDSGITLLYNEEGEVIGKRYTNKTNQLTDNGYVEIAEDSDVIMTKDPSSTPGNIIINYQVPGQVTTDNGDTYAAGSTSIYADYDDFINAVLSTGGLDVDMSELDAETYNRIWEATKPYVTDAFGSTAYDREKIALNMRTTSDGQVSRMFGNSDAITQILKAAAESGMYDAGDKILDDDPVFKAQMRQTNPGSFIGFTPVDFETGYDDPALAAAIYAKIMLYAEIYHTYNGIDVDYPTDFSGFSFTDLITSEINTNMQTVYNKNCNGWLADCWTVSNGLQFKLTGVSIGEGNQVEVISNYPDFGFAYVDINHMTGNIYCAYPYGSADYKTYALKYFNNGAWGAGSSVGQLGNTFMLVYDSEAFINFLASDDAGSRDYPLVSVMVSNGVVRETQVPGVHKRDDALPINKQSTISDIEGQIAISYPDWEGDSYEISEYNIAGDTNVTNKYYPISFGEDSRSGETTKEVTQIIERIPNPFGVVADPWSQMGNSHKLYTVYRPTDNEVDELGGILWDASIMQLIKNIFQDPMDGIISFHSIYLNPSVDSTPKQVYMGSVGMVQGTTPFKLQTISNRFIEANFGDVIIPNFYQDARDIDSTDVMIYIPFSGWHSLHPVDVMGNSVGLKIRCDVCTGDFLATVSVKQVTSESSFQYNPIAMFDGNCSVQVPLTSRDRTQLLTGAVSTGINLATGNVIGAAASAFGAIHNSESINRGNGFKMRTGALTNYRTPFIMVRRPIPADAINFNQFYGYPAQKTVKLSECSGFTRVAHVHVDSIARATAEEKTMIDSLLKGGIII